MFLPVVEAEVVAGMVQSRYLSLKINKIKVIARFIAEW